MRFYITQSKCLMDVVGCCEVWVRERAIRINEYIDTRCLAGNIVPPPTTGKLCDTYCIGRDAKENELLDFIN